MPVFVCVVLDIPWPEARRIADLRRDLFSAAQPPLQQVAFYAAVVLINVTLPAKPLPWPDGFQRTLIGHADERSSRCTRG